MMKRKDQPQESLIQENGYDPQAAQITDLLLARPIAFMLGAAKKYEINRAIMLLFANKIWTMVAGALTIFLIATKLSPVNQGYYFTFISFLTMQSFFELSMYLVIIQFASHEWAHLNMATDGRAQGNPRSLSRLASLFRFSFKFYIVLSLVTII